MKFSEYLIKHRTRLGYSQAELTVRLSWLDDIFKDLSVVTYSRWERDINMPTTAKMLKILIFFKEDMLSFYLNTSFLPSVNEKKAFDRYQKHFYHLHDYWALCSYNTHSRVIFTDHNKEDPLTTPNILDKVQSSIRKFIRIDDTRKLPHADYVEHQKKGEMGILTCTSTSGELLSHCAWSLYPYCQRNIINNSIISGGKDLSSIPLSSSDNELIMYIHPILYFSREWFDFVLKKLILKLLVNINIVEIILPVVAFENTKEMMQLGFEVVKTEHFVHSLQQSRQKELGLRFVGISSIKLLSNYGLLSWFKEHYP